MINDLIGKSKTLSLTLTEAQSAITVGSGDVPVLGTPALIALLENASVQLVAPELAADESTVGIRVELNHTRATALGRTVKATATLTAVEGRKLLFDLSAEDERGTIADGRLERFLISRERFLSKLA